MTEHEHNFLCPILCEDYQDEATQRDSAAPRDDDRDASKTVVSGSYRQEDG